MYMFLAVIWQYSRHLNGYQACAMLHHFHHALIQVTNYEIYNILCLNKLIYTFLKRLQLLFV